MAPMAMGQWETISQWKLEAKCCHDDDNDDDNVDDNNSDDDGGDSCDG